MDSTQRQMASTGSSGRGALRTRPLLALLLAFGLLVAGMPGPLRTEGAAAATPAQEQDWLSRINRLRADKGIAPLSIDAEQNGLAQQRAQTNMDNGVLAHTPSLDAGVTSNWLKLGENVGVGGSVDVVFQAFLASPKHYANLTDAAFTHIGIGMTVDGQGRIWVTHRFLQLGTARPTPGPAPAPAPKPAPRPAPATTAPATTAPPPSPPADSAQPGAGPGTNGDAGSPGSATRPARVAAMLDALHALPR